MESWNPEDVDAERNGKPGESSIINHQSSISPRDSSIINHQSSIPLESSIINHQSSIPTPHSSPIPSRPTWAEISLPNLVHNLRVMKAHAGPGVAVMPAIKADGYGHGAVECARALEHAGADWFGVAMPEEGLKLREAGITRPILCLSGFWDGQEETLLAGRLTPVVFRLDLLERLNRAAHAAGLIADYHLKVDTGMNRLGLPHTELAGFLDRAARFGNTRLDGVMTHLAAADEVAKREFTLLQMSRFAEALSMLRDRGFNPAWVHQANSAAAQSLDKPFGNLVRIGALIYGYWRDIVMTGAPPLDWRPVMSLHTRIGFIKTVPAGEALGYGCTFITRRESRIATLPIGYADGLSRALSNKGRVIVRGSYAPIAGRISMDLTLVDVTEVQHAALGDEVVLMGRQEDKEITAEEIAGSIGTVSYEVTCGVSDRVPRVYIGLGI